ncbi:fluoroquinolone export ABC transporter permease subunit [Palaeococcus ferrophilus]|uniref:fluoroquinolone export ABC transporter permease subunit n=1 Tax=Palaeococcus ferrophilus TaxID=83868 RepID=UPI00064E6BF9|nr:hypothetical protein [Palaeococcus ferrophilus]
MMGNLLKTSVIVGFRSYVYPIYLLVALAYGLMLLAFPEQYLPTMVPVFLILEPGLVGFMFVGTELFAEKKDGAIGALAVTPIEWRDYLLAKTLLLGALSVIASVLIMAVSTRSLYGLSYVVVGTVLASIVYTLLGVGISAKYRDLDDYFLPILGVMVVSLLPFAHYHGYLTHPLWKVLYAVPSYPALYFFKAPFVDVPTRTLAYAALGLILWAVLAYYIAKVRFYRYAVEGVR